MSKRVIRIIELGVIGAARLDRTNKVDNLQVRALGKIDTAWEGPVFANIFVENKDVFGLTVRATVANILNARSKRDRTVWTGLRDESPIAFVEKRDRLIGPIFAFSVRGKF